MIEHQVRSYPSSARMVTRLPELDPDKLAELALTGTTTAAERTETWGII